MKLSTFLLPVFLLSMTLIGASSDASDSLIIPYDETSTVGLGETLDISAPLRARGSCVSFSSGDFSWDSDGSVSTVAYVQLISSSERLARDFRKELSLTAKAAGSYKALKASLETKTNKVVELIDSSDSSSLVFKISAFTKYGRKRIGAVALKPEFSGLLSKEQFNEFRQKCGTHFVKAETRIGALDIYIVIKGLSQSSKKFLHSIYSAKVGAKAKVGIASGEVDAGLEKSYRSTIEQAKKLGTIEIKYIARGGKGISDAGLILQTTDPEKLDQLLGLVAKAAESFSRANSSPAEYLLVPMSIFGAPDALQNQEQFETLGRILGDLLRADKILKAIDSYRQDLPNIYDAEYTKVHAEYKALKKHIAHQFDKCLDDEKCSYVPPRFPSFYAMDDLIIDPRLELKCHYRKLAGKRVLTDFSVELIAKLRLPQYVNTTATQIFRIDEGLSEKDVSSGFTKWALSEIHGGTQNIFGTVFRTGLATSDVLNQGGVGGQVNVEKINQVNRSVSQSTYRIFLPTSIPGLGTVPQTLGRPRVVQECLPYIEN